MSISTQERLMMWLRANTANTAAAFQLVVDAAAILIVTTELKPGADREQYLAEAKSAFAVTVDNIEANWQSKTTSAKFN